ncbi:hypothetical protein [Pyruvatibacter sp.]|uniref:hypothetical protein n=1 Tax=Pyruvatibacter sp. TaxID=1981328 RepID=UPI003265814D
MSVEFIKPSNRLAQLVGGKMPSRLTTSMANRVANATAAAISDAQIGIRDAVEQLWFKVDGHSEYSDAHLNDIYFHAHDLRGLCGTCGETVQAGIADALCTYIEEVQTAGLTPRANVIWLHASSLRRAAQDGGENEALGQYLIESLCALRKKELTASQSNPGMSDASQK